jgi:hypothetical protein
LFYYPNIGKGNGKVVLVLMKAYVGVDALAADEWSASCPLPGSLRVVATPLAKVYRCTRDVF